MAPWVGAQCIGTVYRHEGGRGEGCKQGEGGPTKRRGRGRQARAQGGGRTHAKNRSPPGVAHGNKKG